METSSATDNGQKIKVPPPIPERVPAAAVSGPPPPLPPRLRPLNTMITKNQPSIIKQPLPLPTCTNSPTAKVVVPGEEASVKETATLLELSENPEKLPAVIRVVDGYYGQTSRFSFSVGDCFQAHFLKHSKVLNIEAGGGRKYSVPLTSTMKLGVIHEDSDSPDQFTTSALLAMRPLPRAVAVLTSGDKERKGKRNVSKGDLLIIKEKKQKSLNCFNLSTGADIIIKNSLPAMFSVHPTATKMYPLEIAHNMPDVFPCRAVLFQEKSSLHLGSCLNGKAVVIQGCITEVCVVCKDLHPNRSTETSSDEEDGFVHLPVNGNIGKLRFSILETDDEQLLYDDAYESMEIFNPAGGITYADAATDDAFDIQSCFYQDIRSDISNYKLLNNATEQQKKSEQKKEKSKKSLQQYSGQFDAEYEFLGPLPTRETKKGQSDSEYALIDPLPPRETKKAQLATRQRRAESLSLPATSSPTPSRSISADDTDEYMSIPDFLPSSNLPSRPAKRSTNSSPSRRFHSSLDDYAPKHECKKGPPPLPPPKPSAKPSPKPRPKPRPHLPPRPTSQLSEKHGIPSSPGHDGSSYSTLYPPHLHTTGEDLYELIPGQLPLQSYTPIQIENRAFLKSLGPAQVASYYYSIYM